MKGIKLFLLLILLILVIPIFSIIFLSFQNNNGEILKWYNIIISNKDFTKALQLSIFVSICTALFTLLISCVISLTWFDKKQRFFMAFVIIILGLLPPDIVALSISKVSQFLGFYSSNLFFLIVGLTIYCLPYAVLILYVRFYFIDDTIIIAANDLGLKRSSLIFKVILPLSNAAIISCAILSFLLSFNEYPRTYYLSGSYELISEYLYGKLSSGTDESIYAGGSLVVFITAISIISLSIFFLLNQRRKQITTNSI